MDKREKILAMFEYCYPWIYPYLYAIMASLRTSGSITSEEPNLLMDKECMDSSQ
jgi:hypothetical protein